MAGLALADGGVESANTVGFIEQSVDTTSYSANIGVSFLPVGNSEGNFVVGDEAFGQELNAYDQFYAFDGSVWDLVSYTYNGKGQGWYVAYPDGTSASLSTLSVAPGSSLFYVGSNSKFVTAGQVASSGKKTVTFDTLNGTVFTFDFANPFPIATKFSDLEAFCAPYDQFIVFDPSIWDLVSYTYNGPGAGWYVAYPDGTGATLSDSSAIFLQAGQGCTYMTGQDTTWEVTVNY